MKQFLPVIHVTSSKNLTYNLRLCDQARVDGVFLINHGQRSEKDFLSDINYAQLQFSYSFEEDHRTQVGANFLHLNNHDAFVTAQQLHLDYLWIDNAETDSDDLTFPKSIDSLRSQTIRIRDNQYPILFGGIQFKYQKKPKWGIKESISRALPYINIPTLSGSATGKAADLDLIKDAKLAAGNRSLAIASGITEENIGQYLPYIDYFLVASSITDSQERLIPEKLNNLNNLINQYEK